MTIGAVPSSKVHSRPPAKCMILDLDDTLYREPKIPATVRQRIQDYMVQKLGFAQADVAAKTYELYVEYGTTMAGLVELGHQIDFDEWHEFVHQGAIDYDALLHPDPSLRDILCSIDMPKFVFTNANRVHMERCLARLGISDCFQGLYYFENLMELAAAQPSASASSASASAAGPARRPSGVVCKPNPLAYQLVAGHLGLHLRDVMFFDDSIRNVAAAQALGAMAVLVGAEEGAAPPPGADLVLRTMHRLPHVVPQLLDQPGLVHDGHAHAHARQAGQHHHHAQQHGQGGRALVPGAAVVAAGVGLGLAAAALQGGGGSGAVALPVPA